MNTKKIKLGSGFILAFLLITSSTWAQSQRASPADSAKGKVGDATVSVKYSSPSVKGRKIWGDLVPYDKAWRLGANEATTITTDKELKVEGKTLPAGKYTVFAVPGEKEWQIIFNSQLGQWGVKRTGEANFDPANNVIAVNVKPKKAASMNERLVFDVTGNGLVMRWENVEVPIAMK
jgi:Protein of unknown function (DUF2911)